MKYKKLKSEKRNDSGHDKDKYLKLQENIFKMQDIYTRITLTIGLEIGSFGKIPYDKKAMNDFLYEAVELSESILASHEKMIRHGYKHE